MATKKGDAGVTDENSSRVTAAKSLAARTGAVKAAVVTASTASAAVKRRAALGDVSNVAAPAASGALV